MTTILAIETSCDETAAAVITDGRTIVSNVVSSQIDMHAATGGVIPERAARAHLEAIIPVVDQALEPLSGSWEALDAIAVTRGPGLIGCLLVGSRFAQAAALSAKLPIVGVSHLAGHVYSAWLADDQLEPPYAAMVVSGGHTDCIVLHAHGSATHYAATRDDAVGEAFDKVARMLGLAYPGGPSIQHAAQAGDPTRFSFPVSTLAHGFSFSGLKTAVLYTIKKFPSEMLDGGIPRDPVDVADLAASFQRAAVKQCVDTFEKVVIEHRTEHIAIVGGVAANLALREAVTMRFSGLHISIPPIALCTDNAAMIGAVGYQQLLNTGPDTNGFDVDPGLLTFA